MKKFLIILFLLNINFFNVFAIEPDIFVQSTVNELQILAKTFQREKLITKIIAKETVDIEGRVLFTWSSRKI